MKHRHSVFLILTLLFILAGCGGGGGSSDSGSYTTRVQISLGGTRTASHEIRPETSAIPAGVDSIRFTISAPDMATIQRTVPTAGKSTITESFDVPVGSNRHFLVEALDSSGNVIYQGGAFADVGGPPVSLTINVANVDPMAPVFSGLVSITVASSTSLTLSWAAASDNLTPQSHIQYLIYRATTPGGQDYSAPNYTSNAGATSYTVAGLQPLTTYYFVVRAKDERGNIDQNVVQKNASTSDGTPPTFAGLSAASGDLELLTMNLSWSNATDDVTSVANIVYNIYVATESGQENFASPTFVTSPGATSYSISGLNPTTTYSFVVRAKDEAGNIDTNLVEKSAAIDTVAPSFGGVSYAYFSAPGTVTLDWFPATDNFTPGNKIVYLVYQASTPGGETFNAPTYVVTAADYSTGDGMIFYQIPGLNELLTYDFVVRASDDAGNIDSNTVEAVASVPQ